MRASVTESTAVVGSTRTRERWGTGQGPCQDDALLLRTGEVRPGAVDRVPGAVGEEVDEFIDAAGTQQCLRKWATFRPGDVTDDRAGEQVGCVRGDPQDVGQDARIEGAGVHPVEQQRACLTGDGVEDPPVNGRVCTAQCSETSCPAVHHGAVLEGKAEGGAGCVRRDLAGSLDGLCRGGGAEVSGNAPGRSGRACVALAEGDDSAQGPAKNVVTPSTPTRVPTVMSPSTTRQEPNPAATSRTTPLTRTCAPSRRPDAPADAIPALAAF